MSTDRVHGLIPLPGPMSPREAYPHLRRSLMEMANMRGGRLVTTSPIVYTMASDPQKQGQSWWIVNGELA